MFLHTQNGISLSTQQECYCWASGFGRNLAIYNLAQTKHCQIIVQLPSLSSRGCKSHERWFSMKSYFTQIILTWWGRRRRSFFWKLNAEAGPAPEKWHFFSPPQIFSGHLLKPSSIREEESPRLFKTGQYGLWIYDFKMWTAFSGGWNTIHLLWALNQNDHRFPMIHDASVLKCNACYHSAFLSAHIPYVTSATGNSNTMRLLHNTQYISSKFFCQLPPLIMVTYFLYDLHFMLWHIV